MPAAPTPETRGSARARLLLVGAAFFLSGASALVYQVAWQRILALHSGVGIYSVAMIVAAFMAGLGLGSHVGGVLSARLTRPAALLAFTLVELGVGLFGALSPWLYYDVLYVRFSWLYAAPAMAGVMHFLALVVPTTFMGMSLPLLVRAMVTDGATAGRRIGLLYAINILGASAGAFGTPWVLMRLFGIDGALLVAAAVNGLVAACGLLAARGMHRRDGGDGDGAADPAPPSSGKGEAEERPFAIWLLLYATSGFCALSLEILWFRIVDVAVRSTAFTFGTVLGIYLLGMGAGCLYAAQRRGLTARPLHAFLACQAGILAWAALAVVALARLPTGLPFYAWLFDYWGQTTRFKLGFGMATDAFLRLYVILPGLLYGLPTFLMGVSFPILQQAVQEDAATSGRRVGLLQAANIAGCTAGSLVVGLGLLEWLGTTGSLAVLLAVGTAMMLVGVHAYGMRSLAGVTAIALVLLVFALPRHRQLWGRLHGVADTGTALIAEDPAGVSALVASGGEWRVQVNGKHHSWLPYGGAHTVLGAMAAVVHPAPEDVAIIGLGSGDTAWAAGCREVTRRITVFEIIRTQPALLRRVAARDPSLELRRFLDDPRVEIVVADGRNALERSDRRYDIIEADALWPEAAYSGNLNSVEFYRHCARRLKDGGIMCAWTPRTRILGAFRSAFPHVIASGQFAIGSARPIPMGRAGLKSRLSEAAPYLQPKQIRQVREALDRLRVLKPWVEGPPVNHDLYPRDEFGAP